MANVQINQLPGATLPLDGTELIPADQGLQTVQLTVSDIVTLANATSPYKVYTALLTQNLDETPVPTVLENTIGNIVWTYDDIGVYLANLTGAFTANKTFVTLTWGSGNFCVINTQRGTDDFVLINVNNLDSPHNAIDVNGLMQIEIRVYL